MVERTWIKVLAEREDLWRVDDVWMYDENTCWAVDSSGRVLFTEDGFRSAPTIQIQFAGTHLRCIAFADRLNGWLGTIERERFDQRLYRTTDGGNTWSKVKNLPQGSPGRVCGLSVVDENVVVIAGTNEPNEESAIARTIDGGNTWTPIDLGQYAAIVVDVHFITADEGWVVGGEDVVRHPDVSRGRLRDDCIAIVLHTVDGGRTWKNVLEPIRKYLPRGEWGWKIQVLDENSIFVALQNFRDGAILRSDDGGKTWKRQTINDKQRNSNLEGVGFLDKNRGWVGGYGDADFRGGYSSMTVDGGETWNDASEVLTRINRFRFIGNPVRVGYAAGKTIYKYTDDEAEIKRSWSRHEINSDSVFEGSEQAAIKFFVPKGTRRLQIHIWEIFGKKCCLLLDEMNPCVGERVTHWDFVDDQGRSIAALEFIVRVTTDDSSVSHGLLRSIAKTEAD